MVAYKREGSGEIIDLLVSRFLFEDKEHWIKARSICNIVLGRIWRLIDFVNSHWD